MSNKYEAPQYPPPSADPNYNQGGFQSPPPQMSYDQNYPQQQQYDTSRGPGGPGYYGPPQPGYYGPPQGWNGQQPPPQVIYQRDRSSGGGLCTGLLAGLACCCCLDAIF